MDVACHVTATFQLQQFLHFYCARDATHDICLLAVNVAFNHAICSNHSFSSRLDIALQGPVNSDVSTAVNITLQGCSGGNDACSARLNWSFEGHVGFRFLVEHGITFSLQHSPVEVPHGQY